MNVRNYVGLAMLMFCGTPIFAAGGHSGALDFDVQPAAMTPRLAAPVSPEPTAEPASPEPTDAAASPEPTSGPVSPEPTAERSSPEPSPEPLSPEPSTGPPSPEPVLPESPAPTIEPSVLAPARNVPSLRPPTGSADRVFALLGDAWACETAHHADLVSNFTAPAANKIAVRTTLEGAIAGNQHIDETFIWDPTAAMWRANVADGAFIGSSPRWIDDVWTFVGSVVTAGHKYPGHMVFTALGANAFRRDFEAQRNGRWRIYSLETCSRGLPE
jgi:hypothetical protein